MTDTKENQVEPPAPRVEDAKKTEALLARAFRWPKLGVAERLVCQHLFSATATRDTVAVISHACSAAMMCEALKQKVEDLDFELLKRIHMLNKTFSNVEATKIGGRGNWVFGVPWGFEVTKENFNDYIKPWRVPLSYYPKFIKVHRAPAVEAYHSPSMSFSEDCDYLFVVVREEDGEKEGKAEEIVEYIRRRFIGKECPKCGWVVREKDVYGRDSTLVVEEPHWSFFFEATSYLTEFGFKRLRNAFQTWALEVCMKAVTVMSGLVSPATYDEVAKLFGKEKMEERDEGLLETRE